MTILSPQDIQHHLSHLEGWEYEAPHIQKLYTFGDFQEALSFVNKVGAIAERLGHHPDIELKNYKEVMVRCTTHDEQGITEKDMQLAKESEHVRHI